MSYPALDDFAADPGMTPSRFRVYWYLRHGVLDFVDARAVKIWYIAQCLHMAPRHVMQALDWLVAERYLIDGGRAPGGRFGVRRLRLAYARAIEHER